MILKRDSPSLQLEFMPTTFEVGFRLGLGRTPIVYLDSEHPFAMFVNRDSRIQLGFPTIDLVDHSGQPGDQFFAVSRGRQRRFQPGRPNKR